MSLPQPALSGPHGQSLLGVCGWVCGGGGKENRGGQTATCPPLRAGGTARSNLSRGETHDAVHGSFINLMKLPNVETLIFLVPASNNFMF